jgi:hypothetical protein
VSSGGGASANRAFVSGEKFWLTKVDTLQDGIVLHFLSDSYQDQRYHSTLKVPFPKDSAPTADLALNAVGEVIHKDERGDAPAATPAAVQAAAAPAAPPPPVQTKTIALGQTKQQVIALFGSPTKVVQLGTKEIDYFPDMKVTFVQNKVSDVD